MKHLLRRSLYVAVSIQVLLSNETLGFAPLQRRATSSRLFLSSTIAPAISIENLSCSHDGGGTFQLDTVSYVLQRGSKQGLVGRNGCGKSTLLRILAEACGYGVSTKDEGMVYTGQVTCPRDIRVGFVEQEPPSPSDVSVGDALLGVTSLSENSSVQSKQGIYDVVRRYRMAQLNAEHDLDAFSKASADMDSSNAWSVLTKAEEIAMKLRVHHLQDQKLSNLSGGERKRVALAASLIQEPDVLLLDEPTNHLDLAAIQWLSDLILEDKKLTVLVVTHDRSFLEVVCNAILELDRGSIYSYEGNYGKYLEAKETRLAIEDAAVQSAKGKYRGELDWMRRQPQARQSKSKSRIDAFYKLEKATTPRVKDPNLLLGSGEMRRLGGNIMTLRDASLAFGSDKILLDNFSYDFMKGDRIGIVGRNGVGKSTFIKILAGQQALDSGRVEPGETLVMGIYDQMGLVIPDETITVMEFVLDKVTDADGLPVSEAPSQARKLLTTFEFPRPRWNERVSMLSGGERRRLQLMAVLSKNPNFLLLDEPSNDLDLNTLSALETYLNAYSGVLVVVSHDKFFTDKVTDHLFVFEGDGRVKDYLGSLSEYAECLIEQENSSMSPSTSDGTTDVRKESYKEDKAKRNERRNSLRQKKKDMNNLENAMEKLKLKAAKVQSGIDSSGDEGWTVLAELTDKLNAVTEEVEEKETTWIELAEEVEELEAEDLANG
mmetsp:Transcript_11656/g.15350  ORF Transcript_11656/g.15350 Transcript_11656/m.15350 type:complete len:716 (-) Transcript_11656:9-2156(-)